MGIFSPFHFSVLVILGLLYFLLWIVGRKKRNASAIFWLNFLLGWTVVGWIAALIWALKTDPQSTPIVVNQAEQEWVRCFAYGRYSPPGAKFCSSCGAQISK